MANRKPRTHVLMVVDNSGSMNPLAGDVRGGFNDYVDGLKADKKHDYRVTVALFADTYVPFCVDRVASDVPKLDTSNYRANGPSTALLDAVGKTITDFENAHQKLGLPKNDRVLMVIQTDGLENSSREWTWSSVSMAIKAREELQKWSVIYLGAGLDTWQQAARMGIQRGSYVNTRATGMGTRSTYDVLTVGTVNYAGGATGQSVAADVRKKAGKDAQS